MLRSRDAPKGFELYRAVLGPPQEDRHIRFGDLAVPVHAWDLPELWPGLRWEIVGEEVPSGQLVRSRGPAELRPWACVVEDVLRAFPQARQIDPETNSQWLVRVDPDDYWFVHGLLQEVRR
jgi:hypothetical protein